jgi:hypothetical protein
MDVIFLRLSNDIVVTTWIRIVVVALIEWEAHTHTHTHAEKRKTGDEKQSERETAYVGVKDSNEKKVYRDWLCSFFDGIRYD